MGKTTLKILIFWGYFLATFFLNRLGKFGFSFNFWKIGWKDLLCWFSGALIGAHFLKIEQVFNIFYQNSKEAFSLKIKELLKQKKFGMVWDLLTEKTDKSSKMILRSVLFQVVWVCLALFVLTSSTSFFGKTFIMAIGFYLLLEEGEDLMEKRDLDWVFWPIKRKIGKKEQKIFFGIMAGIFSLFTLILI